MNLTRPLSKDFYTQYSPVDSKIKAEPIHGDDGYFDQVNSRLSDPAFDLREYGINRWEWLPIDPQKNAVEPFRRLGENSSFFKYWTHKTTC